MQNPISFNNLNSWVPFNLSNTDPIDDYFECIVECEDGDKSCALECRSLLEQEQTNESLQKGGGKPPPLFCVLWLNSIGCRKDPHLTLAY